MRIRNPKVEVVRFEPDKILGRIERIGRTCYKSDDKITFESAEKFVTKLRDSGHYPMLEHASISVKFTVDRGVSHELVRHRLCSFAQESTRYCNYSRDKFGNQVTFIEPFFLDPSTRAHRVWVDAMIYAENRYFELLEQNCSPQKARAVLPNSLKTEIWMTTNPVEWRHIFKLRCARSAHPQMRQVMIPLMLFLECQLPKMFNDIAYDLDFVPFAEVSWLEEL
jgi:thymidylate synthase (FAD)